MSGRQGGKKKPLKSKKKKQRAELDEDLAFKQKKAAEAKALKEARAAMKGKGKKGKKG